MDLNKKNFFLASNELFKARLCHHRIHTTKKNFYTYVNTHLASYYIQDIYLSTL